MCLYYRTARPPNDLLNWSRHHFGNCLASLGRCNDLSSDKICTSSFWNCLHRNILFCSPDITTISHHIISLWAAIILYLTPQKSSLTTEQNVRSNVIALPPPYPSASCNSALKDNPNQNIPTVSYHIISKVIEQIIWRNAVAPLPPFTLLPRVTRLSKIIPQLIWLYTHSPSNIDLLTWQNKSSLLRNIILPCI